MRVLSYDCSMVGFRRCLLILVFLLIIILGGILTIHTDYSSSLISPDAISIEAVQSPSPTIKAVPKKCPVGFVLIPGNSLYKTSDFCVMKYDAKCANTSELSKGLEPKNGNKCTNEGTYKNNSGECSCTGSRQVVSTASGFPITYIAETDNTPNNAINYCKSQGWHLITNDEWMTIARNVEGVPDNWCDKNGTNCGFAPGTKGKILVNGHNDSHNEASFGQGHGALVAGTDNQPCFGTTIDGSNKCGGKSSQKRTLTLSNGEIIWDLAGNVWQWIDIQIVRNDQPQSKTNGKPDKNWLWSEFSTFGNRSVVTDQGTDPQITYDSFMPVTPNMNSSFGVGRMFHHNGLAADTNIKDTIIRGGNWRHGNDSGVFTIHMSPVPNKENIDDVGFRCAASL